jgi:hypothetical protein
MKVLYAKLYYSLEYEIRQTCIPMISSSPQLCFVHDTLDRPLMMMMMMMMNQCLIKQNMRRSGGAKGDISDPEL